MSEENTQEDKKIDKKIEKKKKVGNSSKVTVDTKSTLDELVAVLIDGLNNTDLGKVAFSLDDEEDPSNIKEWVSSGVVDLDLAMSNIKNGGFPCGRISEITGLEHSGKSLLGAHFLSNVQKKGGIAVFIDTESAVSKQFLQAVGVDTKNLVYVAHDTIEDVFNTIEKIIEKIRQKSSDRLVGILVDSVAAVSTKSEMETEHGKDGYATGKAIIISKALRKITNMIAKQKVCLVFTNQLRQKLGAMAFSDQFTTSGGKGLAFHSSIRLRLQSVGQIKKSIDGKDIIVGMKTQAKVNKTRFGPPLRKSEFNIMFDSGISKYGKWIDILKENKIITGAKAPYKYTRDNGELVLLDKDVSTLLASDSALHEELYNKICDALIFKYKSAQDVPSELDEDINIDSDIEQLDC